MKNNLINFFIIIAIGVAINSCVNETYAPTTTDCVDPKLIANKNVADIWAIAINPIVPNVPVGNIIPNTPVYKNSSPEVNDVIEGYVISSDEGGNFYQSMYIQPLNKSKGFNISVDIKSAYLQKFQPGKKVFVKMKGLAFANPTSSANGLVFGAPPTDRFVVDRLENYKNFIIPSCNVVKEDLLVNNNLTINQVKNDAYLNTLVEIKDVQFKSDCSTYSKKDFDTSLKLTDASQATIDVRTSRFANFAGYFVPSGSGTIRGVLTKFGGSYQIILRTERDVKLNNPRLPQAPTPAKIGVNSNTFNSNLVEDFTNYIDEVAPNMPKYINQVAVGTKYWDITSFGTNVNRYIQTSAFNNGCTKNYFVVPINFTAASAISFKTRDSFNNGIALKVFYSTNYSPGKDMNQVNLIDISSKFEFADGRPATSTTFGSLFTPSGNYYIPENLTGNGYIIFEYDGTSGVTTTYQIDDIIIN